MQEQDVERHKAIDSYKAGDSNEPWEIIQELLKTGWGRAHLYVGDYRFFAIDFKKVGIERKTVEDLLGSLGNRVSKQLQAMLEYYDICILLIEGSWKMALGKMITNRGIEQWGWSTIWNFLRSWQDRGITLELTSNEGHTVRRLNELYAYYQKPAHTGGLTKKQVGDDRLLAFPRTVGLKTGQKILDQFGSLQAIGNASLDKLLEVEDVGPKRAEATLIHFHRDGRQSQ